MDPPLSVVIFTARHPLSRTKISTLKAGHSRELSKTPLVHSNSNNHNSNSHISDNHTSKKETKRLPPQQAGPLLAPPRWQPLRCPLLIAPGCLSIPPNPPS